MTLILTLIATNKVVQISDRRLTLNGETCDSNANKLVCVGCDDARFSVGYTGVAEIDGQRTDYWLVEQIESIFRAGHRDVLTVYKMLEEQATKAVSRLQYKGRPVHPQGRGLTLVLARYREIGGTVVPFLAYITNVALDAASPFDVKTGFFRKIDLGYRPESQTTAERMAWLVRQATKHPQYGPLVGPDCLSVVIHPNNPKIPTHYHPEKATIIEYGPHLVTPMLSTWDARVDLDPHIPDLADPNEAIVTTSHRRANDDSARSDDVDPDPLRDGIVRYFAAYYQEGRNRLAGRSFSNETVPSHLMPWRKLVRTWETRDGH